MRILPVHPDRQRCSGACLHTPPRTRPPNHYHTATRPQCARSIFRTEPTEASPTIDSSWGADGVTFSGHHLVLQYLALLSPPWGTKWQPYLNFIVRGQCFDFSAHNLVFPSIWPSWALARRVKWRTGCPGTDPFPFASCSFFFDEAGQREQQEGKRVVSERAIAHGTVRVSGANE